VYGVRIVLSLDEDNAARSGSATPSVSPSWLSPGRLPLNFVAAELPATEDHAQRVRNLENVEQRLCVMRPTVSQRARHACVPRTRSHPVLFYDGFCNLCSGFAQFVMARDRARRVSYAPLQSPEAKQFLLKHHVDATRLDTMVCAIGDRVYTKSTAVIKILQNLPGTWVTVRLLLVIPAVIRDWAYDSVGRRRYQWFGQRDTCFLPPSRAEWQTTAAATADTARRGVCSKPSPVSEPPVSPGSCKS
jgi:predicted DCC family thiol-disulfide oxidoreductase YuxK